jgi:hypothetical protein
MPAVRSPRNADRKCWSKRGGRVCWLGRNHLGMHECEGVRWVDETYDEAAEDVDTGGRL